MKKLFLILFILISLLCLPINAWTTTYNVACSGNITSSLQSAITAASNGDIVSIGAGSCTWSPVGWTDKNISIIGAGIDQTVVTSNGQLFSVTMTGGADGTSSAGTAVKKVSWRISGMTITGNPNNVYGVIYITAPNYDGIIMGWRIDHIKFNYPNPAYSTRAIIKDVGVVWGLVDNCQFVGHGFIAMATNDYLNSEWDPALTPGAAKMGTYAWSIPMHLGSDEAIYMEDNTFVFTTSADVSVLAYLESGASVVFRHNLVTYGYFLAHGGGGGVNGRSTKKFEIYNNNFQGTNGGNVFIWPFVMQEGGTGTIFNNTVAGYSVNNWVLAEYRTCYDYSGRTQGNCNGSNPLDGNIESTGWPCMDQVGRAGGVGWGQAQASLPLYTWNNGPQLKCYDSSQPGDACDGSIGVALNGACVPIDHPPQSNYISTNAHSNGDKDYCTSATTMPASCGNHTNTYTPYTYPHPLQSIGPPQLLIITNLRIRN